MRQKLKLVGCVPLALTILHFLLNTLHKKSISPATGMQEYSKILGVHTEEWGCKIWHCGCNCNLKTIRSVASGTHLCPFPRCTCDVELFCWTRTGPLSPRFRSVPVLSESGSVAPPPAASASDGHQRSPQEKPLDGVTAPPSAPVRSSHLPLPPLCSPLSAADQQWRTAVGARRHSKFIQHTQTCPYIHHRRACIHTGVDIGALIGLSAL